MKRPQRLLLSAFSALAILTAVAIVVAVSVPDRPTADDRLLAGLSPEDLKGMTVRLREEHPAALTASEARERVVRVESLADADGTPRVPRLLVSTRDARDAWPLSKDAVYGVVAATLATTGAIALLRLRRAGQVDE